jgi:hypothetical protein
MLGPILLIVLVLLVVGPCPRGLIAAIGAITPAAGWVWCWSFWWYCCSWGEFDGIVRRASMIKKVKEGYKVLSEKTGKNLGGPYKTKEEAKKRLQQVEYFKRTKG